jgi:hypothetical protein
MDAEQIPHLVALIRANASRINDRVVAEMYENPFWQDRFGARGRRFSQEDGSEHLQHLTLALESRSAPMLVSYGQWLQRVLTTRGMCSRHLAENFERLAAAIRDARWEGGTLAIEYLDRARQGLRHGSEPARSIEAAGPAMARAAVDSGAARRLPRGQEDVLDLVSYAADALWNERPDLFAAHLGWYRSFLERSEVDARALPAVLEVLAREAETALTDPARAAFLGLLEASGTTRG